MTTAMMTATMMMCMTNTAELTTRGAVLLLRALVMVMPVMVVMVAVICVEVTLRHSDTEAVCSVRDVIAQQLT